jgi:hypothetical protein
LYHAGWLPDTIATAIDFITVQTGTDKQKLVAAGKKAKP